MIIKKHRGFTMIELLVSLGILSIIISLGFSTLIFGTKSFGKGTDQATLQQDSRVIISLISNEVRNAKNLRYSSDDFKDEKYYTIEAKGGKIILKEDNKQLKEIDTTFGEIFFSLEEKFLVITLKSGNETISSKILLNNYKESTTLEHEQKIYTINYTKY